MQTPSKKSTQVVKGILDYLDQSKQKGLLSEVESILETKVKKEKKADKIIVKSFILLSSSQLKSLQKQVNQIMKLELPISNQIDKQLLGGVTITVGDWFVDASLAKDLNNITQLLSH